MAHTDKLKQTTWSIISDQYFRPQPTVTDHIKSFILQRSALSAQDIAGSSTCSGVGKFESRNTFSSCHSYSNSINYKSAVVYKATNTTYPSVFTFATMAEYRHSSELVYNRRLV